MEIELPKEKAPQKEQIKVTDKRIFTPEGEIREEFRQQIKPADPMIARPADATEPAHAQKPPKPQPAPDQGPPSGFGERRRTLADKAQNPGTAFADFVEPLIAQA